MKNILQHFLDAIEVSYTRSYTERLYNEHPHRDNMLGLKMMLDVYGVKALGVRIDSKDPAKLNYPCVLHTHDGFVIGCDNSGDTVTYLQHGRKTIVPQEKFKRMWTGNALVVKETTEAGEPDYGEHRRDDFIAMLKACSVPVLLTMSVAVGMASNHGLMTGFDWAHMAFGLCGLLVCTMLMEKQLSGTSRYGDKVCSLFHHADCNSVLDGPMAKVFGISWSEVGLGYFMAGIMLLSLYPASSSAVAVINWVAMPYGVWSIHYQWRIAKKWCVLCVLVQVIIWCMGILSISSYQTEPFVVDPVSGMLSGIVFAVCIMSVHYAASSHAIEKERVRVVQQYRALKANSDVAKALIEKGEFYETTPDDSSIIFGNPQARMRVTILSNPHCNPCARMHKRVEGLLGMSDEICVQYIFSSFNEKLEDSSRYLISCYMDSSKDEALRKLANWYAKEKFDYEKVIARNEAYIHTETIEEEMEKHRIWRDKTSLVVTPTILINGHKLPDEYELEDLAMIANTDITAKNIMHDINGRSSTPLGAE